jgi:hypothetical protein
MAQMNWVYLDPGGRRHQVGLYHGDKTRHLLIHCDRRIMQVDFSVKESTMYSFFIEDELCEIYLEKDKYGAFGYEFKINKKADTPLNQRRKQILNFERKQFAVGIGLMVVFIVALLAFNIHQKNKKRYESLAEHSIIGSLTPEQIIELQQEGKWTEATFFLVDEGGKKMAHYTFYTLDSQLVSGKVAPQNGGFLLPTGFQIGDRHKFKAQYAPRALKIHRINFYEPDTKTIESYVETATKTEQLLHPERNPEQSRCLVETVARIKHWTSLRVILEQYTKEQKNTYLRMINDLDVERLLKEKCGLD